MSAEADEAWVGEVVHFWLGLGYEKWWGGDPDLDEDIRHNFLKLWTEKRQLPVDCFLAHPLVSLTGVILFDQFPRNMFRGHAEQYATDMLALGIARAAVDKGFDKDLEVAERVFLYMPFQHSEQLGDQDRALMLITAIGDANYIEYARKHREVIARFGRFPHRNAILGRKPRADEIAAGDVTPF